MIEMCLTFPAAENITSFEDACNNENYTEFCH